MPDIIKPKRATKSVADKSDKVLEKDELLLISPNTGSGTGRYGVKIGDGATATKDLPYAIDGEKADEMIVSEFTKESNENPVLSPGDKIKTLCGKLLKKFTYIETLLGKKVNTSDIYDGTDSSSTTKVATANSVRQVNEKADNNTNQLNQLNSNMIKNKQDASVNPDIILTTDIRTLNGWDAELQKHIPEQLRNQWITCITSSPYDNSASEAVCQIMIGTSSGFVAARNGKNGGGWSNFVVK